MYENIMVGICCFMMLSFAGIMLWGVIYSDPEPVNLLKNKEKNNV